MCCFVLLGVVYLIDAIEMELLKLVRISLAMCTSKRMYIVYYMLVGFYKASCYGYTIKNCHYEIKLCAYWRRSF